MITQPHSERLLAGGARSRSVRAKRIAVAVDLMLGLDDAEQVGA
jgi:hypothetical protein